MAPRKYSFTIPPVAAPPALENPSQVFDSDGLLWNVSEKRYTPRGFPLFFGYPATGPNRSLSLIVTQALIEYWEAHVGDLYANGNLPASRAAVAKIRQALGAHVMKARRELWSKSLAELKRLPVCKFADQHEIPVSTAIRWRASLIAKLRTLRIPRDPTTGILRHADLHGYKGVHPARPVKPPKPVTTVPWCRPPVFIRPLPPKWNKPKVLSILGAKLTCNEVARALKISPSHAQRLRASFRHMSAQQAASQ